MFFCCKGVFHKAAVDLGYCDWEAFQHASYRGYSDYTWLGGVIPHSYITRPLLYHTLYQRVTSVQNEVNWSFVEHVLQVKKHLRHPHLGNKGDMARGCPLLGFYSRVMTRSYKGHFKGKADTLLNRNTFYSFMYFLVIDGHIVLNLQMTFKRKNNHSTEFSVFNLVENVILHKILGLFCQKFKIQDGRAGNHLGFDYN